MAREFIINSISASNEQRNPTNNIFLPIFLSIPGAPSITNRSTPYKIVVGDKEN